MGHFAQINEENVVTQVIVADQDFINTGAVGDPAKWIQTSYNTRAGVHYGQNGEPDGGAALRKNYAGIGYSYDAGLDAFVPPKPFASWVLDTETALWVAPVAMPTDGQMYNWNEETQAWDLFTPPEMP
jgi:hypothetical protein